MNHRDWPGLYSQAVLQRGPDADAALKALAFAVRLGIMAAALRARTITWIQEFPSLGLILERCRIWWKANRQTIGEGFTSRRDPNRDW